MFFPPTVLHANSFSSTMAEITTIACPYLLWKRERRRNARRLWVHHINQSRTELGEFHRLLQELRLDDDRFQRYLRLTPAQFDDLLARIGARISRLDTNYRRSISPVHLSPVSGSADNLPTIVKYVVKYRNAVLSLSHLEGWFCPAPHWVLCGVHVTQTPHYTTEYTDVFFFKLLNKCNGTFNCRCVDLPFLVVLFSGRCP